MTNGVDSAPNTAWKAWFIVQTAANRTLSEVRKK